MELCTNVQCVYVYNCYLLSMDFLLYQYEVTFFVKSIILAFGLHLLGIPFLSFHFNPICFFTSEVKFL
jgi:hypothetical protein